ncbi:uncharacterized protein PGTG_15943 [Puccinia graminis f. sp. tritici CRL 75-36-700-3]|uniref:Uncharacterized protein n=1 Tax=Puccinia graminis f. sp. tritici (strain CRL 75-36-700-3 / race SCCL) TaxID=418459 RepID=E3L0P1_PUCGT|nr:uncharacterized protein PGTG_15943 [Puccinia graminis f. sp. tritici CRL 75-36-700-3]EFP90095.2 hypothetical protein PGTG_15943 [Puccinia graminis f. sp. tritici CRL 75-36-700-3]
MPFTHHHRKWRKARDRGRARRASLIQQTRKTRRDSYHRSARHRHQEPSNSGWSSDSRANSDESFNCAGDESLDSFQLKPAPKRDPQRREKDQQQLNNKSGLITTPAAGELEGAAEGGGRTQTDSSASTMEKIRFMEVVAEVDKAVGIASSSSSSSSSSSDLDQRTFRQPGSPAKDGQAGIDSGSAAIAFFSPIAHNNNNNNNQDPSDLKGDGVINPTWLENPLAPAGRGKLHFNVDIFKSPGEYPSFEPPEPPKATPNPSDLPLEELHAERWECLQQLERRATEASLEGLRKASLKGDTAERNQSISSGSHDTTHSTIPLRKFSSSRQAASRSNRSKNSSSNSRRWGSNESNKIEPIGSSTKLNPAITLSYHPTEMDDTLRREKLLLRSPSVSVFPIAQGVNSASQLRAASESDHRPLGPRPMSKTSNLSRLSEASVQTDENDVLMPLATRTTPYVSPPNPDDEEEVIAIPSSAVKQMVRTSNYLINRKNSSNYYFNPLIHNLQNLNYQDDLNDSNDDFTQPSLIEISLNKVNGEIEDPAPEQVPPKEPSDKPGETETGTIDIPGGPPDLEGRGSMYAGSVDSSRGSLGVSRFRRLSIGDGRAAPRDKRYTYMKTHPPLPPHGPSTALPQLGPAPKDPAPHPPKLKIDTSRARSASLGEAHSGYHRKLPKTPGVIKRDHVFTSPSSIRAVENQKKEELSMTNDPNAWYSPTPKAWKDFKNHDWPQPPSHKDRETARSERNVCCPCPMMAGSVGRREGQEKLYRFAGVKSQSEPSLGFLSSPAYPHHPCYNGFQRQPRKLRKRSNPAFEFNPSEPVPPLPPLPFLSNPACTPHTHPTQTQTHPIHNNPPPPSQQQQHTQPLKNKNFLASIKLFWKSLLTPSPNPHHPPPHQSTTPSTSFEKQKHKLKEHKENKEQIWQG